MRLDELVCPQSASLVIVDMQNDYCHPEGAEAALGANVRLVGEMAPRLTAFVGEARRAGMRIIFVRTLHSPWTNSKVWEGRAGGRHADSAVRLCLPGTWGAEFYAGLEPRQSDDWHPARHDYVVTKHRYSAFVDTDLDLVLRAQRIETLLMAGTASNGCVEATAYMGFLRDYNIVYLADCTAASSIEKHAEALQRVRGWSTVATSAEVIAAWL
ncbi:MAG: cysteine hydrolase [Chloroflexi bacterium]|nr:cysteine hydrolase [Chloroflexota bacterium]